MVRALLLAPVLFLGACTPAKTPAPLDVATAAINVTDEALAAAIETAPAGELAEWTRRVVLLEKAASVVRARGDVCEALPDVALVASLVHCVPCAKAVQTASEVYQCKP